LSADIPVNRVTAVGGGTRTPLWIQTVSDICGIEQLVPRVTVGASYGDALLAGIGIGVLDPGRIKEMIEPDYITLPDSERNRAYEPLKDYFRELYVRNRDIMHALW
jgi:xylulokinase